MLLYKKKENSKEKGIGGKRERLLKMESMGESSENVAEYASLVKSGLGTEHAKKKECLDCVQHCYPYVFTTAPQCAHMS